MLREAGGEAGRRTGLHPAACLSVVDATDSLVEHADVHSDIHHDKRIGHVVTDWELPALGALLLVLVVGLIVYFATDAKDEAEDGAVAEDDRTEAEAVAAEQARVMGELVKPVPRRAKLLELIRKRRERAEAGKK